MDTLTITKPQLEAALLRWEQDAAESAAHLWAARNYGGMIWN